MLKKEPKRTETYLRTAYSGVPNTTAVMSQSHLERLFTAPMDTRAKRRADSQQSEYAHNLRDLHGERLRTKQCVLFSLSYQYISFNFFSKCGLRILYFEVNGD